MARFEVRERVTYDVVDTKAQPDPLSPVYKDAAIMLNTGSRKEAERVAAEHEQTFKER